MALKTELDTDNDLPIDIDLFSTTVDLEDLEDIKITVIEEKPEK